MIYVLDTCIFRKLLDHLPKKGSYFEAVWQRLQDGIDSGYFISVDECFNELSKHWSEDSDNYKWIKTNKNMFLPPSNAESIVIKQIFENKKMQESIHTRNLLTNRPSADAYIAAKAKSINAKVITVEQYKPNSAQLPNICEKLTVDCIDYDSFMELLTK